MYCKSIECGFLHKAIEFGNLERAIALYGYGTMRMLSIEVLWTK